MFHHVFLLLFNFWHVNTLSYEHRWQWRKHHNLGMYILCSHTFPQNVSSLHFEGTMFRLASPFDGRRIVSLTALLLVFNLACIVEWSSYIALVIFEFPFSLLYLIHEIFLKCRNLLTRKYSPLVWDLWTWQLIARGGWKRMLMSFWILSVYKTS